MFLKELQLYQFKNHSESHFTFSDPVNCFVGSNGAGKTNILDAIYFLSQTKSYFNRIDSLNVGFGENYFMIKGLFSKFDDIVEIKCNFQDGVGKNIHNNSKKYKRFSDHIGKFPVVIISPTDSNLIIEGSEFRRRYIDNCISQFNSSFLKILINYNKVLKQRNKLLKLFSINDYYDPISLELYDNQLIEYGESIYKTRYDFLDKLSPIFCRYYNDISDKNEQVSLIYKSQLKNNDFKLLLKESISKDRLSNYTQVGTHKDDVIFNLNQYPIKNIGSQGQQKSFLIALKLAQFDLMNSELGFKPILLLDDIFDKLDENRILKLISFVDDNLFGQVFITDTHADRTKKILNSLDTNFSIFLIDNGKIINE